MGFLDLNGWKINRFVAEMKLMGFNCCCWSFYYKEMDASMGILWRSLLMSEIRFLPDNLFCNFSIFEFLCNNCIANATFSPLPLLSLSSRVYRVRKNFSASRHCSMNEAAFKFHRWWIGFCVFRVCCHLTGLSQRRILDVWFCL